MHHSNIFNYLKLRHLIIIICFMGIINNGNAQNIINSPYSRFGIGDISWKGFGQNNAMGGIGIGIQNKHHLSIINPASYAGLESGSDSMSFTFEFGLSDRFTTLRTSDLKEKSNDMNFSYMAIGFPITKWLYASTGIIPFSNVGYYMKDIQTFENIGEVNMDYTGSGGINQFYIGTAVKPVKNLSIGVNFSYLFGTIEQQNSVSFPDDENYINSTKTDQTIIGDISWNMGLQYSIDIRNDYYLTFGGIYGTKTNLDVNHDMLLLNSGPSIKDTVLFIDGEVNTIVLPPSFGFGFSFGKADKFTVGADYFQQNWKNASFLGQTDSLANSKRVGIGMEFVPNIRAANNYFQRVRYRLGGHHSNTYLQLRENQLTEYGISLGIGLPMPRIQFNPLSESVVNVSFEFGKRGTLDNNLIKESYGIIRINFTLQDIWFKKRKWL